MHAHAHTHTHIHTHAHTCTYTYMFIIFDRTHAPTSLTQAQNAEWPASIIIVIIK